MTTLTNITYRKDLQGLRAIAIILVILAHLEISLFDGGFIGVDVFFVLSGYLITGLLLKEFHENQSIDFFRFYSRRLKRLLPSLLLMLLVTVVITTLLLSPYEVISKTRSAIYASTWTSNIYFAFSKIGYFSELELQDFFLHTWSLSVEEQFYLVWPIFIFTCLHVIKKYIKITKPQTIIIRVLLLVCFISFLLSLYWSYSQSLWAFYLMPTRIWQFSLGGIVFVLFEWERQESKFNIIKSIFESAPAQLIGLLLIILSGILLTPNMTYPGWWALAPSIGTALVLTKTQHVTNMFLAHPILTWVGDRSYAWYLWHWPIILIAFSFRFGHTIIEALSLAIISIFVANVSYKVIEIPFWKGRFSVVSSRKSILASFLAITISGTLILQIFNSQIGEFEQKTPNAFIAASRDIPSIYENGCDSWHENASVIPCTFSADAYNKTIVLIGDSIVAQWFSLITSVFKTPEWRVIVLTKSSCPMVDEDFFYNRIGMVYKICSQWRNDLFDTLLEIKPDVVVTGSAATYPFSEKQWIDGSKRIYSKLSSLSNEVIIIPGTPALTFDGPSCLMREQSILNQRKVCSEANIPSYIKTNKTHLATAASYFKNVKLLDLNNLVCPDGRCSAITNESVVVYRDSQHITNTFARSLTSYTKTKIESFGIKLDHQNLK